MHTASLSCTASLTIRQIDTAVSLFSVRARREAEIMAKLRFEWQIETNWTLLLQQGGGAELFP